VSNLWTNTVQIIFVPDQVRYSETLQVPTSHTDLRADLWGSYGGYVSLKPNAEYLAW
jgi:hypothetical protein